MLGLPRVFGGQILAQGLIAAARTVPAGRPAHSLHAYFLSGGHPERPIEYRVERTRDGGRMTCRTVTASQDGRLVAETDVLVRLAGPAGSTTNAARGPVRRPTSCRCWPRRSIRGAGWVRPGADSRDSRSGCSRPETRPGGRPRSMIRAR